VQKTRIVLVALALAWPAAARADGGAPVTIHGQSYSPYEKESLDQALVDLHAEIDPSPDGKIYEGAEIVTLEVLEERDPTQGWGIERASGEKLPANDILNALHTTSKHYVIGREILLVTGTPYDQALVDQTARNLRGLSQLSLVILVPIKGSAPDRVRLLAVVKDVWSLRLNSDIQIGSGGLESLLLQPTESNLAGTHQTANVSFLLLPLSYELGAGYTERRLAGTRYGLTTSASGIVNRDTGRTEGSAGSVTLALPLYSLRQEWAWSIGAAWRDEEIRRYVNAELSAYDSPRTPNVNDVIPFDYRGRRATETLSVTRSFGYEQKNDFSGGFEMNLRQFRFDDDPSRFNATALQDFVTKNVPVGDTRAGPFLQWRSYQNNFLEVLDVETLALQEDYRLGQDIQARVYPVSTIVGSSRNFVGAYLGLQYTWAVGTGLVRASAESITEYQTSASNVNGLKSDVGLSDASGAGHVRFVSPRLPFGRFVVDAAGLDRYKNYLNRLTYLGGNSRLRGYPSNFYVGKDWVAGNVEYRTRPLEVLGSELGAALFYDVGDAFDDPAKIRLKQSVGLGFRFLFPQLDRFVLRGDLGFPLVKDPGVSAVGFYLAFQQAFGLDTIAGPPGSALGQ
jgi:hypothetical protein